MKKVLFIPSPTLPFPAINGGAVQNLIEFIVEDNEKQKKYEIEISSIYNKFAKNISDRYLNCKLRYINIPKIMLHIRDKQIKYISQINARLIEKLYINGIKNILKSNEYDLVIFENTHKYAKTLNEVLKNTYKILHLHNDYININEVKSKEYVEYFNEVVCVSEFIEKRVKEVCNIKTSVLYNGINTKNFTRSEKDRDYIRNKLNIDNNSKVLLFTGRIVPEKGVLELVKAFNNVKTDNNIVMLVIGSKIYGKTVVDKYTKDVIKEVDLSNGKIKLLGYIDYCEISKYYSACDIGILPSICEEALSLSVIEYLNMKMPVIISNSGGMIELLDNNKCGFIVDKDENFINELTKKIEILVNDNDLYKKYSNVAEKRGKKFDKSNYCEKFYKIISNI